MTKDSKQTNVDSKDSHIEDAALRRLDASIQYTQLSLKNCIVLSSGAIVALISIFSANFDIFQHTNFIFISILLYVLAIAFALLSVVFHSRYELNMFFYLSVSAESKVELADKKYGKRAEKNEKRAIFFVVCAYMIFFISTVYLSISLMMLK